ncbi:hypothetical protein GCM10009555_080390 [Acrocarpospora macrocephala]|uniref:Uncharacterized protein n=1 Tax=Acrocarpospora macrocephala TaxID=150177 RepID=A0A5M3WU76_9ACTN|nr:hypothetical protein Amac_037800 [Acrocarpospora macrocephala]
MIITSRTSFLRKPRIFRLRSALGEHAQNLKGSPATYGIPGPNGWQGHAEKYQGPKYDKYAEQDANGKSLAEERGNRHQGLRRVCRRRPVSAPPAPSRLLAAMGTRLGVKPPAGRTNDGKTTSWPTSSSAHPFRYHNSGIRAGRCLAILRGRKS